MARALHCVSLVPPRLFGTQRDLGAPRRTVIWPRIRTSSTWPRVDHPDPGFTRLRQLDVNLEVSHRRVQSARRRRWRGSIATSTQTSEITNPSWTAW